MKRAAALILCCFLPIAEASGGTVDRCLQTKTCEIQVRGAMTPAPSMSLVIVRSSWAEWSKIDRDAMKARLAQEALKARSHPEKYTDIPKSAPIYGRIIAAIQSLQNYSVAVSNTSKVPLAVDEEVERGSLAIPEVVIPNEKVVVFYTRPLIRQRLHDPDSLQDYSVVSVTPQRKDPSMSEVVVGFRARNRLGALGYEQARFFMSYSESEKTWLAVPVR